MGRRNGNGASAGVHRARAGRPAVKRLTRRLRPEDIAIIDHAGLDRVSAEELVESGVRVVVNVSPRRPGRYPNPGRSSSSAAGSA